VQCRSSCDHRYEHDAPIGARRSGVKLRPVTTEFAAELGGACSSALLGVPHLGKVGPCDVVANRVKKRSHVPSRLSVGRVAVVVPATLLKEQAGPQFRQRGREATVGEVAPTGSVAGIGTGLEAAVVPVAVEGESELHDRELVVRRRNLIWSQIGVPQLPQFVNHHTTRLATPNVSDMGGSLCLS
jgi:hypothetical protein